jgi:N-acetylglucosamine-6-phosphate deacetylase
MPNPMHIKGFFDLQVNGYKGVDFSSLEFTEDAFVFACRELKKKGTVGFLPTIISSEDAVYKNSLAIIAKVRRYKEFERLVPGIHLEGPFISAENGYRGIHPLKNIKEPDIGFLRQLMKWSGNNISMMTIAAEKEGAEKICSYAVSKNIVISLGHQQADEKHINSLARKGAKALTHLGNGLPHLIHRHVNPIWSGIANDGLAAMIITDGFHLPVSVIQTIIKAKGVRDTILVSDLSPLGGMKAGKYSIWGSEVTLSRNGFLHDPSTGYLAASSFSLLDCVNYILMHEIVKLNDVNRMAFHNPLQLLGINPALYRSSATFVLRKKKLVII